MGKQTHVHVLLSSHTYPPTPAHITSSLWHEVRATHYTRTRARNKCPQESPTKAKRALHTKQFKMAQWSIEYACRQHATCTRGEGVGSLGDYDAL
eukprot:scaffold156355_cov36-Tisochrysis_lutea.AAC.4